MVRAFGLYISARPLAVILLGLFLVAAQDNAPDPKSLKAYHAEGGEGASVYEVPIEGTIELGLAAFVERVLADATAKDVVILRIKTFGGRVDAAVRIRDALLDASAKTVAYIDRRAISAGALISLACDTIIMSEGASIGAATPVQSGGGGEMKATSEKVVSYMRAEMRATAEAKGRRADIAEAMVDAEIEVKDISEKGKLLTLTSSKALEYKIADAVVEDFTAVYSLLNLGEAKRHSTKEDWGERLARILTDPTVSSLLMTFGMLGVLMELYSPGFGVGGIIGATCLALFFFGQYAANLAGAEELVVLAVGLLLLALELLVIPGFGIAGFAGIGLIAIALGMSLVEFVLPMDVSFALGYAQEALWTIAFHLSVAFLVAIAMTWVILKRLPTSGIGKRLILSAETEAGAGYVSAPVEDALMGAIGVTMGPLRPAGIADFAGRRLDVVSEGRFIEENTSVKVINTTGNRIVVREVQKEAKE